MTLFEQYVDVSEFVQTVLNPIAPVFMEGEVIEVLPPYYVIKAYGVGAEYMNQTREDTRGYSVYAHGKNRGKTEKIVSDALDLLMQKRTSSGLSIDNAVYAGFINRLEDSLYEGIVTFSVISHKIK